MDYIIVQAGGKGTRLQYLTKNKPKALVPIDNLPMLFHLFRKYPEKRYIIIADYKKEVLREYLSVFAEVKYQIVDAVGTGTCSGIRQALELIPDDKAFMLIWSDLILPEKFELPEEYTDFCDEEQTISNISGENSYDDAVGKEAYIGISKTFPCRWSYAEGRFKEESSYEHGVAGFFLFGDKGMLKDIPESGELVRWLQEQNMKFKEVGIGGTREFGLLEEYQKLTKQKCRPFNRITVEHGSNGDILVKEAADAQGEKLAKRECAWYEKVKELQIPILPQIYDMNPLKMELIKGKNIYECDLSHEAKRKILEKLVRSLEQLHNSEHIAADSFSIKEAYFHKTFDRLAKIEDLVPFAREREIVINGRKCRNIYYHKRELEKKLENLRCTEFSLIHGDCTFSNMMIRDNGEPVLIDPRGYFGFTEIYGDVRYDWAKMYYSIAGNYDRFNLKEFTLEIGDEPQQGVKLEISSNHWEDMEEDFFELTGADKQEIKLLHAVIWLSLTTYAWEDYDSICGALYKGLYELEEIL